VEVQGFYRILPDCLGVEQLSIPLNLLIAKGFRFSQQPLTTGHIRPDTASRILRKAFDRIGIEGASTHSFRRTALTQMSNNGVPLRIIQEVSGHKSLDILEKYLEVRPEQVISISKKNATYS
jgi:integrase